MQLRRAIGFLLVGLSVGSFAFVGCTKQRNFNEPIPDTQAQEPSPNIDRDVPYVPTPPEVIAEMLEGANVNSDDVIYDLGSGDGRVVITAAEKYGARGVGVEIDPELVEQSRANAEAAGVSEQVEFLQQDLFATDLSEATVVTLYLLPDINLKLRSKLLQELKPGTRVVSHDFDMGEWKPERVERVRGRSREHTVYYWVVPEEVPENLE